MIADQVYKLRCSAAAFVVPQPGCIMTVFDQTFVADGLTADLPDRNYCPRVLFLSQEKRSTLSADETPATGLNQEGWTFTRSQDSPAASTLPVLLSRWWPKSWRFAAGRWIRLSREIPAHDLVHISMYSARQIVVAGLPSLVLARFFGKKVLVQFVSADIERLLERRRLWLLPFLRLPDAIVVGSRYLQKVFGRAGLPTVVMPRPLVMAELKHRTIRKPQPKILINCPLEDDYNVACGIKAFRLVKQKYPRSELTVIGEGSRRIELANMLDRHSLSGVQFKRSLRPEEVSTLYAECDLFLHSPLVDESPPGVVAAFAAGLPVVTTDADGLLHMVRDGVSGLLAPVGNHVGLANNIIELIENPELCERLSNQGKVEARKYSWARLRQDWVNLYRSLGV